jgi:hypothetical protein
MKKDGLREVSKRMISTLSRLDYKQINRFALILIISLLYQYFGTIYCAADGSSNQTNVPAPVDRRILVSAVDSSKNQVTLSYMSSGKTVVYALDAIAQIIVDKHPGNINNITVGQQVMDYIEHDAHSLDSLSVGEAQTPPVGSLLGNQTAGSNQDSPQIFITNVDLTKNQITITNNNTRQAAVYGFDFLAEITLDNQPVKINDIKSGQQVFSYIAHDAHSLDCLKLGTPAIAPEASKGK